MLYLQGLYILLKHTMLANLVLSALLASAYSEVDMSEAAVDQKTQHKVTAQVVSNNSSLID